MKKVKVILFKNGEEVKSKIVRIVDVQKTRLDMMPFMYTTDRYWTKVI
jgi:hypothetical protein